MNSTLVLTLWASLDHCAVPSLKEPFGNRWSETADVMLKGRNTKVNMTAHPCVSWDFLFGDKEKTTQNGLNNKSQGRWFMKLEISKMERLQDGIDLVT